MADIDASGRGEVKPSVDSGLKNKDSLPGSDAKKSVTPTIVAPSVALVATLLVFLRTLPLILLDALYIFEIKGILPTT